MRVQNALPRTRPRHSLHVFRLEMVAGGKVAAAKETPSSRVSWRSKLLVFASCSHGGPWTCALLSKETAENCLNHKKSRQTISCYDDALIASVAIILGGLCANLRWLAIHISWRFQGILDCSHIFALEFPWISCKWPLQKPAIQMQSRQQATRREVALSSARVTIWVTIWHTKITSLPCCQRPRFEHGSTDTGRPHLEIMVLWKVEWVKWWPYRHYLCVTSFAP